MKIEICNWEIYNPRNDVKNHTWFRCQNDILTNPQTFRLDAAQKCIWICLLAERSKVSDASFTIDVDWFSYQLRVDVKTLVETIRYLEDLKLLNIQDDQIRTDSIGFDRTRTVSYTTDGRTNEHICTQTQGVNTNESARSLLFIGEEVSAPKVASVPSSDDTFDFESAYKEYPKRQKGNMAKATGMKRAKAKIKSKSKYQKLLLAVKEIKRQVEKGELEKDFIPMWSTFVNRYEDYLPENNIKPKESPFDTF